MKSFWSSQSLSKRSFVNFNPFPKLNSSPPPRRIVAIGDLHGDLDGTMQILRMTKLINSTNNWIGGECILVQTGDIVDRGPYAFDIYELFKKLEAEATIQGGQVIQLLGNHEVMNMQDDWRYVTDEDIHRFGGPEERKTAFSSEGELGQYLRTRNITAWVDGNVFFHGGATFTWAKEGIEKMNSRTKKALKAENSGKKEALFDGYGPLWYRGYAVEPEKGKICKDLRSALKAMNAKRMIIGHTPQQNGRILPRCNNMVFVIDVGISRVYGGHRAALEIIGDQVNAIYKNGKITL